jgi:DNA-binding GntR family transcriptional regulator
MPSRKAQTKPLPESAGSVIARYFRRAEKSGFAKNVTLQRGLVDAIVEGALSAGDQIPPEQQLTKIVGLSLGTIQKALRDVAQQGLLRRRQGRGTFVAERTVPETDLWHHRFLRDADMQRYLPVSATLRGFGLTRNQGAWTTALGRDDKGYLLLDRVMNVDGKFKTLSHVYLPASRFGSLQSQPLKRGDYTNIRLLLRERFGVAIVSCTQSIRFVTIYGSVAKALGVVRDTPGLLLSATSCDRDGVPVNYQEITIPSVDVILDLSYSGAPVGLAS